MLGFVVHDRHNVVDVVPFSQRAGRTDCNTLTASHAFDVVERQVELAADIGVETAVVGTYYVHMLQFAARRHAPAAENTLAVVSDKIRRDVLLKGLFDSLVSVFVAAELMRQLLQLAVVASHAAVAAVVVVGKQKLDGCLAGLQNTLGVCLYFHAVAVYGVNAGGDKVARADDFHHADAAGAYFVDFSQVTKRGNFDAHLSARIEYGRISFHGIFLSVDFYSN